MKAIEHAFNQGQQALQMQLWDIAEQHFKNVLVADPKHTPARAYLAFSYVSSKKFLLAEIELKKLLAGGQNLAQTHFNLANVLHELKRYEEAVTHFNLCLKYNAGMIDALVNCAISNRMLKQYEVSISLLLKAIELKKTNPRAMFLLGLLYLDIKDQLSALKYLNEALVLEPKNPDVRIRFAETLEDIGFSIDAGQVLHGTCTLNPNHYDSFMAYGDFLKEYFRNHEAIESYSWALELKPNDVDAIEAIGKCYAKLGNAEKAIHFFNSALSIEPNRLKTLVAKAEFYLDEGKLELAKELAHHISSAYPKSPSGYILLSRITKIKSNDALIPELINTLETAPNDEVTSYIHFALGKIYDDLSNYSQAFNHYNQANQLRNKTLNYDHNTVELSFNEIIEFYNESFFNRWKGIGCESSQPVFIIGMPRSGTTLTEQILSSHPSAMGVGEVVFWVKSPSALPIKLQSEMAYPECVNLLSTNDCSDIAQMYLKTIANMTGDAQSILKVVDKMPHNFMFIGLIALIFPNAKIIHTRRHPIDTCLSIFFQSFSDLHNYSFSLQNIAHQYNQYERLMAHWHKVLPGRILDINYEDTIADPEYWSRKLIEHVGLEWDDACLSPHKIERSVKTASVWQVRQPIYKTSVERWRNYEPYIQPLIDGLNKPIAE